MTTTLIAKRTRIVGSIDTDGDVVIEGRVEGAIRTSGCVTVGVSGLAISNLDIGRAVVLGIVIGDIKAAERVDVAGSARVVGDVRAPMISIAAPGSIEGKVEEIPANPDDDAAVERKPTLRIRGAPLVRPAWPEQPETRLPPRVTPARGVAPLPEPTPPPTWSRPPATPMPSTSATMSAVPPPPPPPAPPTTPPARASGSQRPVPPRAQPTEPARAVAPDVPRPPNRVRLVPRREPGE